MLANRTEGHAYMANYHAASPLPSIELDIVICTCNAADRLPLVLDALAAQAPPEDCVWDVTVVDSASTDKTAQIVEAYRLAGSLPSLRYVYESKPGRSAARQRGIRETCADWIVFLEADGTLERGFLTALAAAIRCDPAADRAGLAVNRRALGASGSHDTPAFADVAERGALSGQAALASPESA